MREVRWLTRYGPEGASSRYRAFQLAPALSASGWSSSFEPLAQLGASRMAQLAGIARRTRALVTLSASKADVVVVQKEPLMPPAVFLATRPTWRPPQAPLVWDIDDAVWLGRAGARRMAVEMCRRADLVVAGNDLLADWAQMNGAEVVVVPTCFEPEASYDAVRSPIDRPPSAIVWIGSPATAPLLEPFEPLLRATLDLVPDATMEFIGGSPPAPLTSHPRVTVTAWSPKNEWAGLNRADFGLALQPRTEYADHKCGFKIVQYMAYGITPIAVDNPVHRSIVGDRGVLIAATSPPDAIVELVSQRPSRRQRDLVHERWARHYSRGRAEREWAALLERFTPAVG